MESQALAEVHSPGAFSMFELIMAADPVVKLVLIALIIASIWSWAVVAEKLFSIGGARKKATEFEDAFWNGRADDYEMRPGQTPDNAGARLFASISREWRDAKSVTPAEHSALVSRAERSLRASVDREVSKISNGIGALATIGLLDHHRHKRVHICIDWVFHLASSPVGSNRHSESGRLQTMRC